MRYAHACCTAILRANITANGIVHYRHTYILSHIATDVVVHPARTGEYGKRDGNHYSFCFILMANLSALFQNIFKFIHGILLWSLYFLLYRIRGYE